MFTPFFFGGIEIIVPLLLLFLIVVFVVRPGGSDRHGRRPFAVYLFVASFVSLMTVLGALGFLGAALGDAVADTGSLGGGVVCPAAEFGAPSLLPDGSAVPFPTDECVRSGPSETPIAIRAVLVAFVAGGIFYFHATQARALLQKERSDG